ncbi:putative pentatricopeptide repeat-containing protein, mitochondrial [Iris pallida]|uniref:Pentatricopeptide repeat-containing protein, mitochondrial n=1 Tax=Iris pallida TaxID=29817 RepID=A0AAX6HXQ9_IRIPA|nr:putative pentatricopeptide repeat-containing protein, mitochondrial [Iris pallida]
MSSFSSSLLHSYSCYKPPLEAKTKNLLPSISAAHHGKLSPPSTLVPFTTEPSPPLSQTPQKTVVELLDHSAPSQSGKLPNEENTSPFGPIGKSFDFDEEKRNIDLIGEENYRAHAVFVEMIEKNEPDDAMRVLDEMVRSGGLRPNVTTFTILVDSLCKKGRLRNAFGVLETMRSVGCEPAIRTYNCLVGGLCYVGRVEEAVELLNKLRKSPVSPDIYTFTLAIDGLCKVGRTDEAMELLEGATDVGLKPSSVTYNSLLNGYCKEGRPLEGLPLLEEMERSECDPDFISYSILLRGFLMWGETVAALEIYKKMRVRGFRSEERAMNTLLRGLCRQSMALMDGSEALKEGKELFERMISEGYKTSPYTYCLLVEALAKGDEIDDALAHLCKMAGGGYSPRMITCNAVFRILCKQGRVDDALHVLILMIERDSIPSSFSIILLLEEFTQQGRQLEALGVYGAAVKRGILPSQKSGIRTTRKLFRNLSSGEGEKAWGRGESCECHVVESTSSENL